MKRVIATSVTLETREANACTICSRPHTECPDCRNHQFCDYCYHCEQHPMDRRIAQARAASAKVQS